MFIFSGQILNEIYELFVFHELMFESIIPNNRKLPKKSRIPGIKIPGISHKSRRFFENLGVKNPEIKKDPEFWGIKIPNPGDKNTET